jgi:hypothetical protein
MYKCIQISTCYIQSPRTVRNQVLCEPNTLARLVASWEMSGEAEARDMGSHAQLKPRGISESDNELCKQIAVV